MMNPLLIVLAWVGAYFFALVMKRYVGWLADWNFFILMLVGIVIESLVYGFGVAFVWPLLAG